MQDSKQNSKKQNLWQSESNIDEDLKRANEWIEMKNIIGKQEAEVEKKQQIGSSQEKCSRKRFLKMDTRYALIPC